MEALVQYLLQNNKDLAETRRLDQDDAIRREEAREDRAERRRKQELIEAEERQERREARQLVLLQEAEDKKREQKVEDERRAFNLQQEMLKFQTELGEKAEDARRIEFEKCRDRDKAKAGILTYKDSDDVEEYIEDAEKKLATSGIPEAEWGSIIASKLHGRLGASWGDLRVGDATFKSMKAKLLSSYGYTPKIAGDQFFNFKQDDLKTADCRKICSGAEIEIVRCAPSGSANGHKFPRTSTPPRQTTGSRSTELAPCTG